MVQVSELKDFNTENIVLTEGNLGLERVWKTFGNLCRIPRPSEKEAKAISFVREFATQRQFQMEEDQAGNILFFVPATDGMEKVPGIVFQGHLDMVTDGEPNPAEYGVVPFIFHDDKDQAWVTANNTTLGADNGIGVSLILALTEERLPHGPLAFLLTNREEIGLVSAREMSLKHNLQDFKFLINLDSEEEGEATISSAGAADTYITYSGSTVELQNKKLVDIKLDGLMGGHSGIVIGEGKLNAAKVMSKVLSRLREKLGTSTINLVSIESGTARNAIPKAARVTVALDQDRVKEVNDLLQEIRNEILQESKHEEEQQMVLEAKVSSSTATIMYDNESTAYLLNLINDLPDGLIKYSEEIKGFPETSTNIGIVRPAEKGGISIQIMTRSAKMDELEKVREQIRQIATGDKVVVDQPEGYSGWPPVLDSEINRITSESWQIISGHPIELQYTHGGLECGVLMGRFPHLQAISIGPEIRGAHTTEEMVNVGSVKRCYKFLQEIIKSISRTA